MTHVPSSEARAHLRELLDRASKGESITITRYGRPVAQFIPVDRKTTRDPRDVIQELLEFRKGRRLGGLPIRDMIADGRGF